MLKVCLRYTGGDVQDAGALYNQSMLKVFRKIDQYKGQGELEGWIRRIVVNTCIDHCRIKIKFSSSELNNSSTELLPVLPDVYNRLHGNEITALVHTLPKNTGLVFTLFVLEGYKHEEIGHALGISTGTSKWHLNEARRLLRQKMETLLKNEAFKNAI